MKNPHVETMDMVSMISIADGNPGCLQMLVELHKRWPHVLYGKCASILMALDIAGEKAYLLWNDLCKRDIEMMTQLLLDLYIGRIPLHVIREGLANPDTLRTLDLGLHVVPDAPWMEELACKVGKMLDSGKRWEGSL